MPSVSLPPSELDSPPLGRLIQRRTLWEALIVVALSLIYLLLLFHLPISDADEGLILTGAERILRGQVPFRDFFTELGPASYYLQAVIFRTGGLNLEVVRGTAWLVGGALSGLIFLLARAVITGAAAFVPSLIFSLVCYPHAYRVSHHWWGNVFLLLATLCLAAGTRHLDNLRPSKEKALLLAAGVFSGATLLSMQTKGAWAVLMGTAFLIFLPWFAHAGGPHGKLRQGLRDSKLFVIGVVVMTGTAAAFFASQGALPAWLEDNFHFLLTSYGPYYDVPQASPFTMLAHLGQLAVSQQSFRYLMFFAGHLFFFLIGPAIAYGGTAWQLLSGKKRPAANAPTLLLFLLMGLAGSLSEYHDPDLLHLMYGTPLMIVLLAQNWSLLIRRGGRLRRVGILVTVVTACFLLAAAGRKVFRVSGLEGVHTRRGVVYVESNAAPEFRSIIESIEQRVPAGGKTFYYPYEAELYFLTATQNPTRYDVLLPHFHTSAQVEEAIAGLRDSRPSFIFSFARLQRWTIRPHFPDDPPDAMVPHPVEKALAIPDTGYHFADSVGGMEVWATNQ